MVPAKVGQPPTMLLLLLLAWAFLTTTYEIFAYAVYLERYLRPKIRPLVGTNSFWKFEQFLARNKTKALHFLRAKVRAACAVRVPVVSGTRLHPLQRRVRVAQSEDLAQCCLGGLRSLCAGHRLRKVALRVGIPTQGRPSKVQ